MISNGVGACAAGSGPIRPIRWTPDYLAEKLRVLAALPEGEPWLTCIDERLAAAAEGQLRTVGLLRFKRRVDATALLRAAEEQLAATSPRPSQSRAGAPDT